jgi:hypothetical protein
MKSEGAQKNDYKNDQGKERGHLQILEGTQREYK